MDATQLAGKMLQWEAQKREIDALEVEIKDAVMDLGKTQNVGNVRASYSGGRKRYDYRTAVAVTPGISDDVLLQFTTEKMTVAVDWRGICKHEKIADISYTRGDPSVSLKLTG